MNLNMVYSLISLILFISGIQAKNDFPDFIKTCKKSEDISKCVLENVNLCKPYLKDGIPKLFLPPVDPLFLPLISMKNPGLSISLKNFSLYKLNDFEVKKLDFDLEKNKFYLEVLLNKVHGDSQYGVSGKLLMFQLNSSGHATANITKLLISVLINFGRETKGSQEYFKIKNTTVKQFPPEALEINMENLFGENQELTRQAMKVINENGLEIFKETREIIDSAVEVFLDSASKKLFNKYSINELFSD